MRMKYSRDREEIESGCKYAENCFECPFSDCIISMHEASDTEEDYMFERQHILERARHVKRMKDSGKKIKQIAIEMNCPVSTVRRDLIIAKEEERKNGTTQSDRHEET